MTARDQRVQCKPYLQTDAHACIASLAQIMSHRQKPAAAAAYQKHSRGVRPKMMPRHLSGLKSHESQQGKCTACLMILFLGNLHYAQAGIGAY